MQDVTNKLYSIFHIVNEWLKYAENKNSTLLAFSGTLLTAIVAFMATVRLDSITLFFLFLAVLTLVTNSILAAIAFLPRTDLKKISRSKPPKNSTQKYDNLYYFGDIRKYTTEQFIAQFKEFYMKDIQLDLTRKEFLDLSNQVVINSEIAFMKFELAKWMSRLLIIALLTSGIAIGNYSFSLFLFAK